MTKTGNVMTGKAGKKEKSLGKQNVYLQVEAMYLQEVIQMHGKVLGIRGTMNGTP